MNKYRLTRAKFKKNGEVEEFLYSPGTRRMVILTFTLEEMEEDGWEYVGEVQPRYFKTLEKVCEMIASGEIPKEVYDRYLGEEPVGFMSKKELMEYFGME